MKYSALTPELLAMTRELEELGGGDARVGRAVACVVASPAIGCQSILQANAGGLIVQDTRSSRGSKTFPLPNFQDNQSLATDTLRQAPVDWLLEGFNATVFAFGQSGTGKSATLFAKGPHAEQPLFHSIVQQIFAQLPAADGGQTNRIGFSFWEVQQHQVFDLLAHPCQEGGPHQALHISAAADACQCVEASSEHEALSLLHAAQCSSSSWTSDQHGQMRPLPSRAHLFVRIVLYNAVKQQLSTLHVIDLAGSQSFSDHQGGCSSLKHQEKLAINQQLLSLSKFISELSRLSTSPEGTAKRVTSARDSPLVQLVGPLLAGDARTFMLAAVSPHPDDYLDTVNTLRIAARAQNIQTACMRTTAVRPEHVRMVPAAQMLDKDKWSRDMRGRDSRQEGAEAQQGASRHCIQHPLASASHAQLRQQRNPAPGSIPSVAWQDSRTTPHLQQQQQLDVGFTLTAANALSSLGHHEVADAEDLDAAPQQQNSHQPSLNPACTDVDEQSLSCEQCAQRPGQDDGRAEAEVHAGVMGDEMCAPIELTWEGVQASSGNNQVAPHPGPLSAEPSFAFRCQPPATLSSLPPSMLQQHAQPTSALYTRHTASGTSTSCDAEAALHQPYVGFPAGQQLPAAGHDAQSRPTAELSGEGGLKQPNRKQGSSEPGRWGIQLPVAEATAECHGAVRLQASAHTPQELADHLDKLKKEFRQIYSTILDGDAKLTSTAAVVQPVTKSSEGRIADDNVPITSKHSRSHEEPMLPSLRSWQAPCPSDGDASMPVPPCIIPCTAADCTHFSTAPAPAQQQQPQTQQQSHHIMQQQQVQLQLQQSRSQSSQHSSSSHAIQPGAARQKHADHAVMATPPHDDQSLVEADSSLSLRERLGQSSASRAASNVKGKTGRQQETSRQQGIHGSLGRHAPPVGAAVAGPTVCDGMARRHESSSTFGDGLRPCSPSECCSHEAAARAQAGDGNGRTQVQDLRLNNEALLCMLERERQHSQRLAQALQQAEANALEGSLEQAVQMEEGRLAAVALRSKCRKLENESLFADVFEKYEEEIRQLQAEVRQLKQSNTVLGQQLALHEVEGPSLPHPRSPLKQVPVPSQTAGLGEGCHSAQAKQHMQASKMKGGIGSLEEQVHNKLPKGEGELGMGQDDTGQGELRLQALRKQLRRSAAQCDALKAELAEGKRRDRTADLYKKKANDGVRRVSELQKEVARLKQELHSARLAAVQAAKDMSQLQDNKEFVEAEHVSVLAANQDLQASLETLREQVRLLRSQRQRAVVMAHLPALRHEAQMHIHAKGPSQGCAALDVARRLQLEPAQTPKMAALIERVADEVHLLLGDRETLRQRESILMDILTGHYF